MAGTAYVLKEQTSQYQELKMDTGNEPYLEIIEEPKSRGYRFRYECEGGSHGNIYGETTSRSKKSYPAVKIHNYTGAARVTVTLVTQEDPPQPHTHELIGKDCHNGTCSIELKSGSSVATFSGLAIKHSTRRRAGEILKERVLEKLRMEKFVALQKEGKHFEVEKIQIPPDELDRANSDATERSRNINLSVVRLCFSATLRKPNGECFRSLTPVVSMPVYDAKSPGAAALKICRMDKSSGCCTGEEEVFLLCDKVQKEDIAVCFQEFDENGFVKWEAYGSFGPQDVHRQFAIVFRTPPYASTNITSPVPVMVKLKRLTKDEVSNQVQFTYYPEQQDMDGIRNKKRKKLPNFGAEGADPYNLGLSRPSAFQSPGGGASDGGVYGGVASHPGSSLQMPLATPGNIKAPQPQLGQGPPRYRHTFPRAPVSQTQQQQQQLAQQQAQQQQYPVSPQQQALSPQGQSLSPQMQHVQSPQMIQPLSPQQQQQQAYTQAHLQVQLTQVPISVPQSGQFAPNLPTQFAQQGQDFILQQQLAQHGLIIAPDQGPMLGRGVSSPRAGTVPSPSDQRVPEQNQPKDLRKFADEPTDLRKLQDEPTDLRTKLRTDSAAVGTVHDSGVSMGLGSMKESDIWSGLKDIVSPAVDEQNSKTKDFKQQRATEIKKPEKLDDNHGSSESSLAKQVFKFGDRLFKALQDYATTGDVSYLLLVQRHLVAQQDDDGDNILHLAVLHKKVHVLRDLLRVTATLKDYGATNQANFLQQTPLHLATALRDAQMVELLLSYGASPGARDNHGNTPLHVAAQSHAPLCLQNLLSAAASQAKPRGSGRSARRPVLPEVNMLNYEGLAPLHIAVVNGTLECVKLLLHQGGADINLQEGKSGKTPLHFAVEQDELAIVGYLAIETKAEVNTPSFSGATALHQAVLDKKIGCISILMASGADPDFEMVEAVPEDDVISDDDGENWTPPTEKLKDLSLKERKRQQEEKERDFDEDKDVIDNDSGTEDAAESDGIRGSVLYITPRSLAEGHEKIERILNGVECTEPMTAPGGQFDLSSHLLDLDPHTFDTLTATQRHLHTGQMPKVEATVGDMKDLDAMCRTQLARLLDPARPGHDWRELAHRINLGYLVPDIEMIASPTKGLLDNYEALDGTLSQLKDSLERMERADATKIVGDAVSAKMRLKSMRNPAGILSHVGQLPGSFAAMSLKS